MSKAEKIRAHLTANPTQLVKDAAKELGVNLQYVYLIKKQMAGKVVKRKRKAKPVNPNSGQEALRKMISADATLITELRVEVEYLKTVVRYLESKVQRGAAV